MKLTLYKVKRLRVARNEHSFLSKLARRASRRRDFFNDFPGARPKTLLLPLGPGANYFKQKESSVSLDPIYYTDEYPREGCVLTINLLANDRVHLVVSAPNGKHLESYAAFPYAETPRVLAEWLSGKAPNTVSRRGQPSTSGSMVTV